MAKSIVPDMFRIEEAENEIRDYSRAVKFTVSEYSFEHLAAKLTDGRYYVPDYQREHTWDLKKQSKFIESIFMGLPIPFAFFWQNADGRMEIVDGSQRLRTVRNYMDDKFKLKGLTTLPAANGFKFSDFSESRRLKFAETTIRAIILDNSTDAVTRTEMFARINTGGTTANDAEIRRGSLPGPFMSLVISLAERDDFTLLTPISSSLINKREREELVTRFFAYLERYKPPTDEAGHDIEGYKEEPRKFYFSFVSEMNAKCKVELAQNEHSATLEAFTNEFTQMIEFVNQSSPNGFTKTITGKQVPRVRFEAIAVGSALAIRANPELLVEPPDITPLLESDDFDVATKSDAANVKSKLLNRLGIVRDWLLNQ